MIIENNNYNLLNGSELMRSLADYLKYYDEFNHLNDNAEILDYNTNTRITLGEVKDSESMRKDKDLDNKILKLFKLEVKRGINETV